ncbi:hypothetical protein M3147_14040 [Agromyces mediolanus]|uniref:hypothetical protein n=1 Tax=Agromyces mediolanus TaxID=41986 RepID=UPI00204246AD|nr:hypothetical protein [Agromyces mediolanus]MCM3658372.1 hypothetical protein [Agromyces mediolanus]
MTWDVLWADGEPTADWSHAGIVAIDERRIAFGHPSGRGLVILDATGGSRFLPTPTTEVHGLSLAPGDGVWVADPGFKAQPSDGYREDRRHGRALLISLEGEVLTELRQPEHPAYEVRPWRPTSVVAAPDGSVWVADGYGENLVHRFDSAGAVVRTLGDAPSGVAFDCPHGLVVDPRIAGDPRIVLADRGHRRLVWLSLDGDAVQELCDAAVTAPSCLAVRGDELLVTDLCGGVRAVDRTGAGRWIAEPPPGVVMTPPWPNVLDGSVLRRPLLEPDRLHSPHGIAVGADGDLYLTEWLIGGRQLRIPFPELRGDPGA